MKMFRSMSVCPCCECEIAPVRSVLGRLTCSFCTCEFRHNVWHWFAGITLLGGVGYGSWLLLGRAFSAGFTLSWPFQLLLSVVGAFLATWPIIGLVSPYRIVKRGEPPKIVPLPQPKAAFKPAAKPFRKAAQAATPSGGN